MKLVVTDRQFALMAPTLSPSGRAYILPHLNAATDRFEINRNVYRLAAYMSNLLHESGEFKYMHEIWGNTKAQRGYDTRTDLGNTPERDGDGKLYMGRSGIQRTGKKNYQRLMDVTGVDVINHPEKLEDYALGAISDALYWSDTKLNGLADLLTGKRDGNETKLLRAICKRINGGYNGLADRVQYYWRCLAILKKSAAAEDVSDGLTAKLARSEKIPEIQHPAQAAVPALMPPLSPASEAEVVKQQEKAASLIDSAEKVPPSAQKVETFWGRVGGPFVQVAAWFGAGIKAGDYGAWALLIVLVAALLFFVFWYRKDLRRWYAIGQVWVSSWMTGAEPTGEAAK